MKQIKLNDKIIIVKECGSESACPFFWYNCYTGCKAGAKFDFNRQLKVLTSIPENCPLEDYKEEDK